MDQKKVNPVSKEDWQKYHTAWQNYYQKYYSEYYAKAAKIYVKKQLADPEAARQKLEAEEKLAEAAKTEKPASEIEAKLADLTSPVRKFTEEFKKRIQSKASDEAKGKRRLQKFYPLIAGAVVILLILFLQYNRLVFAPLAAYVSPGNAGDDNITAINGSITTAVGEDSRLMIPKLNVDVPIIFGISNDTRTVNDAMNRGVAHFAIPGASAMPGEIGNLVITGHSAGDIYSNNQYKFIFSGLERLSENDLIYIDYQGIRYTYSITKFETVEPSNVGALVYETDRPVLTLITCTPLGTSRYRLLVTAEQISPASTPTGEGEGEQQPPSQPTVDINEKASMPQNEPTFFERIFNFFTGR